jgi:hypothetical protein
MDHPGDAYVMSTEIKLNHARKSLFSFKNYKHGDDANFFSYNLKVVRNYSSGNSAQNYSFLISANLYRFNNLKGSMSHVFFPELLAVVSFCVCTCDILRRRHRFS